MGMKKRIFIFGIFSLLVNINFLASKDDDSKIPKYKLIFLGDHMVGKSCILERFMNNTFLKEYQETIGLDFRSKEVKIDEQDDQKINLLLYGFSGQEKFKSLIPMYTQDPNIILLVYDVTSKDSFLHLPNWFKDLTNVKKEEVIFAVVGNKIDLDDKKEVNSGDGENYAKENGFIFAEVSAKSGEGINDLFEKQIYHKIKEKFLDKINHIENLDIKNKEFNENNYTEKLDINGKIEDKTKKSSCASCLKECFFCC